MNQNQKLLKAFFGQVFCCCNFRKRCVGWRGRACRSRWKIKIASFKNVENGLSSLLSSLLSSPNLRAISVSFAWNWSSIFTWTRTMALHRWRFSSIFRSLKWWCAFSIASFYRSRPPISEIITSVMKITSHHWTPTTTLATIRA